MLVVLLANLAHAGTVRALVEVDDRGERILDAVRLPGRAPSTDGPVQVRDPHGTVIGSTQVVDPRLRTLITPDGGVAADSAHGVALVDIPWPDGAASVWLHGQSLVPRTPLRMADTATAIQVSGDSVERLDLVILGDGYAEQDMDAFADDAQAVADHMLSVEPWGRYRHLFNIWRIDAPSAESGLSFDTPQIQQTRDTTYSCSYGCENIARLVCCDDATVLDAATAAVPGADGILVLLNSDEYGGAGGFSSYATAFTGDEGVEVAVHELSHSMVQLWDEYNYGGIGSGRSLNCSADAFATPWEEWDGHPGIGTFESCTWSNYYRPTDAACMMNTLRDGYCPVCRQAAVLAMYAELPDLVRGVDPPVGTRVRVDKNDPPAVFEVDVLGPGTITWDVDGTPVGTGPRLELDACAGVEGELMATVTDETPWVRSDPEGLLTATAGPWDIHADADCEARRACGCGKAAPPSGSGFLPLLWLVAARRR